MEHTKNLTRQSNIQRTTKKKRKRRKKYYYLQWIRLFVLCIILAISVVTIGNLLGIELFTSFWSENYGKWKLRDSGLVEIYENKEIYPEELLEALSNNSELLDFVKGFPASDGSVTGGLTKEELSEEMPLLMQWDSRWGYAAFGDNNIALSGCAPTCLSMVIVGLTGNAEAAPNVLADFIMDNGYYFEGTGTSWSIMTEGSSSFGVLGQEISLSKNIVISHLKEGHPIICSMRPGDFTTTGHFIVLRGVEDEKIIVNDPYSRERSEKLWDYETLESQIKNLWVFTALEE